MRIAVWYTGHTIADTVAQAIPREGINRFLHTRELCDEVIAAHDLHICYGILRGAADVFRTCDRLGKNWANLDKGYFKPDHFLGFYRVSLRGTQQTSGWPEPDWERWKALGLTVEPMVERTGEILVCPQTEAVGKFTNAWLDEGKLLGQNPIIRLKGCERPLENDLDKCRKVITFNSSVGWEALRRGIPVESDPVHSIVGAWQAKHGLDKREELFATMAALDLTLDEMRGGKLLPLMENLLKCA